MRRWPIMAGLAAVMVAVFLTGGWLIYSAKTASAAAPASDLSVNHALGVYVGDDPQLLTQFEAWRGGPAAIIALHTGRKDWADWQGSLDWVIGRFRGVDAVRAWTLPLFVIGGSLDQGAAGAYNANYVKAARSLVAAQPSGDILVRTGVEFNGDWMPWAAKGREAQFAHTYRNFVTAFRSVSTRFKFEWNVNAGGKGVEVEKAYPGDAYVDIIGMDFYYDTRWYGNDGEAAWNRMVNQPYGLRWLDTFAAAHQKPSAYSEWGVNSDTGAPFVRHAAEWFANHNVAYQIYWNSDAAFAGRLDNGQYPAAGAAYKAAFADKSH